MNNFKFQLFLIVACLAVIPLLAEKSENENQNLEKNGSLEGSKAGVELSEKDKRYRLHGKRNTIDENLENESGLDDELSQNEQLEKRYRLYGKRFHNEDDLWMDKRYRLAGKRYRLMGKRYRLAGKRQFESDESNDDEENKSIEKRYRLIGNGQSKRYRLMGK